MDITQRPLCWPAHVPRSKKRVSSAFCRKEKMMAELNGAIQMARQELV